MTLKDSSSRFGKFLRRMRHIAWIMRTKDFRSATTLQDILDQKDLDFSRKDVNRDHLDDYLHMDAW